MDEHTIEDVSYQLIKDDITNQLSSSPFQLGEHTVIIIYEVESFQQKIKLQSSQQQPNNNSKISKNLEIIKDILFQQILTNDFNYYSLKIPVNYPIIIFSKNRTYFQSPRLISLPIQSTNFLNENYHNDNPTIMNQLNQVNPLDYKIWWSKCMKLNQNIIMDPKLIERIENDYIQYRQLNENNILSSVDNLQNILTLIRLHVVSCHEHEITFKHWLYILNLENSRKLRNEIT